MFDAMTNCLTSSPQTQYVELRESDLVLGISEWKATVVHLLHGIRQAEWLRSALSQHFDVHSNHLPETQRNWEESEDITPSHTLSWERASAERISCRST